jgi:hypothetical protein
MTTRHWRVATLGAALLGTAYSLSPVGAWLLCAFALIVVWACRGADARERRWLLAILIAAFALRVVAIWGLVALTDPRRQSFTTLFGDAHYTLERATWLRNVLLGIPISPLDQMEAFKAYGSSGSYYPMALLEVLLGNAPFGLHLFNATMYLLGGVTLYRAVRSRLGARSALVGLAVLLFMPTLFIWSISPLKESTYFFLMAIALASLVGVVREPRWWLKLAAAAVIGVALAGIGSLRSGGLQIAVGGMALGVALAVLVSHRRLMIVALVAVPLLAIVALRRPDVHARLLILMREGAHRHIGHVQSVGTAYRILSPEYYYDSVRSDEMTFDDGVNFLGGAFRDFALIPKPWNPSSRSDVMIIPQQIVWYALLVLMVPGAISGLRRDPLLTSLLLGNVLVGAAVIAPNSGNVGTLLRHRDMVVPFVVWLGAHGAVSVVSHAWRLRGVVPAPASDAPRLTEEIA